MPSLNELADLHAAQRWPRRKREADLRRHGYDPAGAHGDIYRDAFRRARQTRAMARFAERAARTAAEVCLWDVPDGEWPEWIATGCGDMPLSEYRERLAVIRRQLEAGGHRVRMVPATVAEVLGTIARLGLQNDPAGRSAAIGLLADRSR